MSADLLLLAAIGTAMLAASALLGMLMLALRLRDMRQAQRRLILQLDAIHSAQTVYAQATEGALSHLRDGLQTLTTVCANLDMKAYALELRQVAAARRSEDASATATRRRDSATPASAPGNWPGQAAKSAQPQATSAAAGRPSTSPMTPAEAQLMAKVRSANLTHQDTAA